MIDDDKSDAEWVKRVQSGETEAYEVLVRRHQNRIFGLLFRWLGDYDDAADAAQDVFLAAFRGIGNFRGEAAFGTWLYRIATNHAKNRRKQMAARQQRTVPLETTDSHGENPGPAATLAAPDPNPAQALEQRERERWVQQALNSLDVDEALVILMKDFQGMSYDEMAQVLQVPRGTVKSRLHRARQALKEKLAPYFVSPEVKQ